MEVKTLEQLRQEIESERARMRELDRIRQENLRGIEEFNK